MSKRGQTKPKQMMGQSEDKEPRLGQARPKPGAYVGGFRSGTTLLINLLGLHPLVSTWFEAKFLPEALRWMRVLSNPDLVETEARLCAPTSPPGFDLDAVAGRMRAQMEYDDARLRGLSPSGKRDYERYSLGADRIHYSLAAALEALRRWREALAGVSDYHAIAQETGELVIELASRHLLVEPAPLLINKTPELPRFGQELRACLGPHKMILVIRDGREVVRSAAALGWAEPRQLAYMWRELILQSRAASRGAPTDYLEVRYEDLVAEPDSVINGVCRFLEIPPMGAQIIHHYVALAGIAIEVKASPERDSSLADWDAILLAEAGDLLKELQYLT